MERIIAIDNEGIKKLVMETVNKTLEEWGKHMSGRVSSNGNGMVGGRWESWEVTGTVNILDNVLQTAYEDSDEICDNYDEIRQYLESNRDSFDVTADFVVSYDESTGMGSRSGPCYEMRDVHQDIYENLVDVINNMPTGEDGRRAMWDAVDVWFQKVSDGEMEDDFDIQPYEEEYNDYDD